jgi:hypothetical protein
LGLLGRDLLWREILIAQPARDCSKPPSKPLGHTTIYWGHWKQHIFLTIRSWSFAFKTRRLTPEVARRSSTRMASSSCWRSARSSESIWMIFMDCPRCGAAGVVMRAESRQIQVFLARTWPSGSHSHEWFRFSLVRILLRGLRMEPDNPTAG